MDFIDAKELFENLKDFSIKKLGSDTPKVVEAILNSFYVNKALEKFGFLDTVKNTLPFDVIKKEGSGILYKKAAELKKMIDTNELIPYVQKNIKFNEVTKMLGVDLANDEKLKDIDFIKNLVEKNVSDAIASFKNAASELKVKDIAKFAGLDFMKDERFKDIEFFRNLNEKPINQFLEATKDIASKLTLGNVLKIANVDESKLKVLREKNLSV